MPWISRAAVMSASHGLETELEGLTDARIFGATLDRVLRAAVLP
jgi:hypothetical protein